MSDSRFKFSSLRRLLSDLGFKEVVANTDKPHVAFRHEPSDLLIVLPPYRNNATVAPHHLVDVRMMLDGKGFMDAGEFDRIVSSVPTRHSASN